MKHLKTLKELLVSFLMLISKNKHGKSGTSENTLVYKQNGFYFEVQASDFQIPLAYFVIYFFPHCASVHSQEMREMLCFWLAVLSCSCAHINIASQSG